MPGTPSIINKIESVLIVDDDEINNFITKRLLYKWKVTENVNIAINGADGIKYLEQLCLKKEKEPNLILLDINMPIMDGFEFLEKIKTLHFINRKKILIAVLTTSSDQRDRAKMNDLGIKHYLEKPITEEAIKKILLWNFSDKKGTSNS